uniref:NADH-ubiquinone oxidoreductase chain 2 n=1 Tax=Schizotus pectinicornis TaxID=351686 RepID=A0A343C3P4_9CUCU|nr:NADH dehydrogenase subunit 2 [Schizotus pectinicornis]
MLKLYKILFFNMMIFGTLISISAYSWFSMWMGLEINLLSIIPLLNSVKNIYSSEASLKYFITQVLASLILIFSIIMMLMNTEFIAPELNSSYLLMLNSALMIKLGAAPFHFWFPEVMEGLNWMNCLILLTWQKIAPMILIMNLEYNFNFLLMIILFSLIISIFMSFNQMSLRKIMTFSSINHISWMISAMLISFSIWLIYFSIYMIITFNIIMIFYIFNIYYFNQINNFLNFNKNLKFFLMMNFMSLGGLPPFLGFFSKWIVINWLILNNYFIMIFFLIIFTLIMLYIYIRMMMNSLILMIYESKIHIKKINNFLLLILNFFMLMSLILCTFMFSIF